MRPCLLSFKRFILVLVLVVELLPSINIAYSNTYGLIYTFSSLLLFYFLYIMSKIVSLFSEMVENNGFEPLTLCVQGRCSSQLS